MKIDIDYYVNDYGIGSTPIGAMIHYKDECFCATGATAYEAKQKVVAKFQSYIKAEAETPKRETVDVPLPIETEELPL